MGETWPKFLVDPVHQIIPFQDDECDRLLLRLINTREFQRLRRIKQLGFTELVFPGANHSRFSHSIGVMHTARMFLERMVVIGQPTLREHKTIVLAAALLHDVGHGPFSHAFEKVTGESHEKRTLEIIRDNRTDIGKILLEFDKQMPKLLSLFFTEDVDEEGKEKATIPGFLTQVVSSQLDADRFDYLIRDSYATGTNYGNFDLKWLLGHLHLDDKLRFTLSHKALLTAEAYVFARYHMYRTVYYHKTTRAAEVMLQLLFRRFRDLINHLGTSEIKAKVVPLIPESILRAFAGGYGFESVSCN